MEKLLARGCKCRTSLECNLNFVLFQYASGLCLQINMIIDILKPLSNPKKLIIYMNACINILYIGPGLLHCMWRTRFPFQSKPSKIQTAFTILQLILKKRYALWFKSKRSIANTDDIVEKETGINFYAYVFIKLIGLYSFEF